jgi:ABC-2 type transport system permease protein
VVGVLIRMKLALVRHSMTGGRATQMIVGVIIGGVLGVATLLAAAVPLLTPPVAGDLLAALFVVWTIGWLLGPLFAGGGEGDLRPEFFTLMPISSRRLARGLLAAAFAGIGPLVTLVGFAAMIGLGVRLDVGSALVAIPATAGALVIVVLASRVMVGVLGEVMRSRLGALLVAIPWAVIIAAVCDGAILLYALGQNAVLAQGFDPWLSNLLRILPSGWGLVAVEAAHESSWLLVLGAFAAMAVLILVLLALWAKLLDRRVTGALAVKARVDASKSGLGSRTLVGAVIAKERRTWSRDILRSYYWYFALAFSLALCLFPLVAGLTVYLPWAGSMVAIVAAAVGVNVYSADGSAIWLTLMTPRALRADVRGRQYAWLLLVAPTSLVITIAGTAVSGHSWAWPWALTLNVVALGAGAGLMILLAVVIPPRIPDAHKRSSNPAVDGGNITGLVWAMIGLVAAAAVLPSGVVLAGTLLDNAALRWAGPATGLVFGLVAVWLFGHLAYRRLAANGPELLFQLRTGQRPPPSEYQPATEQVVVVRERATERVPVTLPDIAKRRAIIGFCLGSGWIPLLAGLLSLIKAINGGTSSTAWTFPLLLPGWLQIPVSVLLIALWLLIYAFAARTFVKIFTDKRRLRRELETQATLSG